MTTVIAYALVMIITNKKLEIFIFFFNRQKSAKDQLTRISWPSTQGSGKLKKNLSPPWKTPRPLASNASPNSSTTPETATKMKRFAPTV